MSDQTTISRRAGNSFRLGLASFLLMFFAGVPAIVQGIRGLRDIRRSNGYLKGKVLAWTGMSTGFFGSSLGAVLMMLAVDKVSDTAARAH